MGDPSVAPLRGPPSLTLFRAGPARIRLPRWSLPGSLLCGEPSPEDGHAWKIAGVDSRPLNTEEALIWRSLAGEIMLLRMRFGQKRSAPGSQVDRPLNLRGGDRAPNSSPISPSRSTPAVCARVRPFRFPPNRIATNIAPGAGQGVPRGGFLSKNRADLLRKMTLKLDFSL